VADVAIAQPTMLAIQAPPLTQKPVAQIVHVTVPVPVVIYVPAVQLAGTAEVPPAGANVLDKAPAEAPVEQANVADAVAVDGQK